MKAGDYAAIWPTDDKEPSLFRLVTAPPPADWKDTAELLGVLIVQQDRPKRQFSIPMSKIRAVHPVIGCSRPGAAPALPGDWEQVERV